MRVGDLKLPEGVTTDIDESRDIVSIVALVVNEEPAEADAEAAVEAATEGSED